MCEVLKEGAPKIDENYPMYTHFGKEFMDIVSSLPENSEPVSRTKYIDMLANTTAGAKLGKHKDRTYLKCLDYLEMLVRDSFCKPL